MEKKIAITTLIFDFGGVIINLDLPTCIQNLKKLGTDNIENYLSNFGQKDFFLKFEKGEIGIPEFRNEIRKLTSKTVTDNEIDNAWCSFLCEIPNDRLELLEKLRSKYRLLLLSNSNPLHVDISASKALEGKGKTIRDYFDKCYFSYEMGMAKPDSQIFESLLKDAGLEANECLFLDDGPKNIEIAQSLGLQTYFVKQGENLDFLLSL
ncbi:MAG: HAD family hydrolase [Paludibacter sp.]